MAINLEFKKDVSFLNVLQDLENFVASSADRLLIDITDTGAYPAFNASGEFTTLGLDADTLEGHPSSYFSISTHNHNTTYLSLTNTTEYIPTENYHPATKKYVDDATSEDYALANHNHDTRYLSLVNTNIYTPSADYHPATKKYIDDIIDSYDTNGNGKVDEADSVAWANITSKPTTFIPASHNHAASEISSGSISAARGVIGGSSTASFLRYNGITRSDGQLYGSTTTPINNTRLNYDGYFYATKVYTIEAADFADCRELKGSYSNDELYNKIVTTDEEGNILLADENSKVVLGIVSNNYGYLAGGSAEEITDNIKVPISMAGFIKVKAFDKNIFEKSDLGNFVVPYKDGLANTIDPRYVSQYHGKVVGVVIEKNENDLSFLVKVINI